MQALGRVLAQDDGSRAWWGDFWYGDPGSSTMAGPRVNAESVMGIPAVYACTTVIAEDIGSVPLQMFEDMGDNGRRRATNHPLDDILSSTPNPFQTAIEFRESMQGFMLLRRFGIAEIKPGPRGPVDSLWPLHPDLVREDVNDRGERRYHYRDPRQNGRERILLSDEVFVVRGKFGRSILDFARESLGLELAFDRYQTFLFSRGSKHVGVVSHPKVIPDPIRKGIRKALDEYSIGGARAGRPLLLEDGMTWTNASITPHDAEFLLSRKFGIRQVCRWFRMQPHKIADLEDAHFTNIETQNLEHVTDTLLPHTIRWEQAITRDLIIAKLRFYARHNLDAKLRGEILHRYQAYALALMWGWLTGNEVRSLENRNPLEGLDTPRAAVNTAPVTSGAQALAAALGMSVDELPAITARASAPEVRGRLKLIASGVAGRLVRRELAAVTRIAARNSDPETFRSSVETFYAEHVDEVARDLAIPQPAALGYVREQRAALMDGGPVVMEAWLEQRVSHLTDLAMDRVEAAA